MKTKKTPKQPTSDLEIPVWLVEVKLGYTWAQYYLRLSAEVATWLEGRLRGLMAKKKIADFKINQVDKLVEPAFVFYAHFGLDG